MLIFIMNSKNPLVLREKRFASRKSDPRGTSFCTYSNHFGHQQLLFCNVFQKAQKLNFLGQYQMMARTKIIQNAQAKANIKDL